MLETVNIADSKKKVNSLAKVKKINSFVVLENEVFSLLKTICLFVKNAKTKAIINAKEFAISDNNACSEVGLLTGILNKKHKNQ